MLVSRMIGCLSGNIGNVVVITMLSKDNYFLFTIKIYSCLIIYFKNLKNKINQISLNEFN